LLWHQIGRRQSQLSFPSLLSLKHNSGSSEHPNMQIVTPATPDKPTTSSPSLIPASAVLEKLWDVKDSYYLGDPNLATKAMFYIGGMKEGNILIVKDGEIEPIKFLLC